MKTEIIQHIGTVRDDTNLFKILPNPCVVLEADSSLFSIIDANEAFKSLIAPFENDLSSRSFFDAFATDTDLPRNAWANLIEKAVLLRLPIKTPVIKYHRSLDPGELVTSQIFLVGSIAPVLGPGKFVGKLVCSFTDISEIESGSEHKKDNPPHRNTELLEETERLAKIGTWEADLTNDTLIWSYMTRGIYEVGDDFTPSFDDVIGFFRKDIDRQVFIGLVEKAMENGDLFDAELEITTARGNERWIRITGQAGYADGRCNRVYGAVQDTTEKRNTEHLLVESRNQLRSLMQSVNGIFWEADAQAFAFSFVSDHVKDILGYTPEEWLADQYFWENHIHPDDRQQTVSYCQMQVISLKDHTSDYRMIKADGSIIWIKDVVSIIVEDGRPTYLRGLMVDITETKRIEELAFLEKSVLELNTTNDTTLHELLITYLSGIETIFSGTLCSLHKLKDNCLESAFAPTIPSSYLQKLYNLPIGPSVGSCGTAAFLKERVIVADIANDPRWAGYSELASQYNLRACWSQPIINSDGIVIATLGFYYNKVKAPQETELIVIERCAAILKVILENRQKSVLLEESSLLMKQGQELAGFGNWQWDILNNVVQWSDELYSIYGVDKTRFKATFEGYQELLHPDDRERVKNTILAVLQDKTDVVFEERIIRGDGEIRHLKSWGRLRSNEKGLPVKMIGACLDITESRRYTKAIEQQNEKLSNIAFMQSHVVRPPLARLMGVVDLIRNYDNSEQENQEFLDFALASAQELDGIIRDIAEKTRELPGYS